MYIYREKLVEPVRNLISFYKQQLDVSRLQRLERCLQTYNIVIRHGPQKNTPAADTFSKLILAGHENMDKS